MKLSDLLEENTKIKIIEAENNPLKPIDLQVNKVGNSFQFALSRDEIYKFATRELAEEALEEFASPDTNLEEVRRKYRGARLASWARRLTGGTLAWDDVSKRSRVVQVLNKPYFKFFTNVLSLLGVSVSLWQSLLINIESIRDDYDNGIEPGRNIPEGTSFQDAVETMYGIWVTEIALLMYAAIRRAGAVGKVLSTIRNFVRAGQLTAAGTGVGAIPALISAVVSEIGFQIAMYAFTNPKSQKLLMDWVLSFGTDSLAGYAFQGVGGATVFAADQLGRATGADVDLLGALGVRDAAGPGFEKRTYSEEGAQGTAFATSEWAKLVFQDLLFPPGTEAEDLLVPYINKQRRQQLLDELFGSSLETPNTQADSEEPVQTSEPGLPENPDAAPVPQ
jgi:hypothetical protein